VTTIFDHQLTMITKDNNIDLHVYLTKINVK